MTGVGIDTKTFESEAAAQGKWPAQIIEMDKHFNRFTVELAAADTLRKTTKASLGHLTITYLWHGVTVVAHVTALLALQITPSRYDQVYTDDSIECVWIKVSKGQRMVFM